MFSVGVGSSQPSSLQSYQVAPDQWRNRFSLQIEEGAEHVCLPLCVRFLCGLFNRVASSLGIWETKGNAKFLREGKLAFTVTCPAQESVSWILMNSCSDAVLIYPCPRLLCHFPFSSLCVNVACLQGGIITNLSTVCGFLNRNLQLWFLGKKQFKGHQTFILFICKWLGTVKR